MVIADTSIWVDHFRHSDEQLRSLLNDGEVGIHPWIIGELACGNIGNRVEVLAHLRSLPKVILASDVEAHHLIERRSLAGLGIGWIDVHLLASATLSGYRLWTRDRRLLAVAQKLSLSLS